VSCSLCERLTRRAFVGAALAAPIVSAVAPAASAARPRAVAAPRVPTGRYAMRCGWALLPDGARQRAQRDTVIVVSDGRIDDIRTSAAGGLPEIDLRHCLVLPGFISGHTHVAAGTPTRGLIETGRSFARPLELVEALDDDALDAVTALNLAELLRSGTTTQVEMSLSLRQLQSYVRVARRYGARGYAGAMIPGIARLFPIWFRRDDGLLTESVPGTLAEIAANLEFARTLSRDGLIRPMMTPHATDTQTPETLRAFAAAARELACGVHLHLAQSPRESATVERLWGTSPLRWIERHGLAEGPLFAAHLEGFDFARDAAAFKAAGAVYAHCPSARGAGGGTQPYPEALGAGLAVNVGIDTHSNDYVENLKLAVLYGQARHEFVAHAGSVPARAPTMADAVAGATLVAAQALRRPDLGQLAAGARADLVAIDVTGPLVGVGALPPEPLNHLLYASGAHVEFVATDGRIQVLARVFVADDLARVSTRAGEVTRTLWTQLAREGFFEPGSRPA
jgi:cytosine/adenosine deaminase-related metal-dependent hydrolase